MLVAYFWGSGIYRETWAGIVLIVSFCSCNVSSIQAKLEHEGEYLDQVKDFKFLGSYKSADGDRTDEIKRRIAMARQKAVELTTIWKDKNVTSALKIRVMKSMVWAVFQYGVEGWTLKK